MNIMVIDIKEKHVSDLLMILEKDLTVNAKGFFDPERALECMEEENFEPDMIICGDDGGTWDFAYYLLTDNHISHRPFLAALKSNITRKEQALCEECGFDIYAKKPVKASVLKTWMEKAKQLYMVK